MSVIPQHSSEAKQEEWAAEDRDDFAELRSHDASKISYDFQKATGQACLLINGGAATAVIALLAKDKVDPTLLKIVPWCLALYASGVAVSAVMMFCSMMLAENWNYFWYRYAYTGEVEEAKRSEAKARFWQIVVWLSCGTAIASFLVASITLSVALTMAK